LICLVHPLRFLGIRTRISALVLAALALSVAAAILLWPPRMHHSKGRRAIDRFLSSYDFHEVHEARVHALPEKVYEAIEQVRVGEIRFVRPLMAIRSLPARLGGHDSQPPSPDRPILEDATSSSFLYLAREPPHEIVVGTVGRFWRMRGRASPRVESPEAFVAFSEPGCARAAMNFAIEDLGDGWSRVTTETRILGTDAAGRRLFATYWRLIYPGSSLIRIGWLEAIKRRAES
jgi:hypothetical protein